MEDKISEDKMKNIINDLQAFGTHFFLTGASLQNFRNKTP